MLKKIYIPFLIIILMCFSSSAIISCGTGVVQDKMYKFAKIASYAAKSAIINSEDKLVLGNHLDQSYLEKSYGDLNVKDELGPDFSSNKITDGKMSSLFQMMFGSENYTYNNNDGHNLGIKTLEGGLTPKSNVQAGLSQIYSIVYGYLHNGVKKESLNILSKLFLDTLGSLSDLKADPNAHDGETQISTFGQIDNFLQSIKTPILDPLVDALQPIKDQGDILADYESKLADEINKNPSKEDLSNIISSLIHLNPTVLLNKDKTVDQSKAKLIISIIKFIFFNTTVAYNYYDDYLNSKNSNSQIGLLVYWNTKKVKDIPELKNNELNGEKLFNLLSGMFQFKKNDRSGMDNFVAFQSLLYSPGLSEIMANVLSPILDKFLTQLNLGKKIVDKFKEGTDESKEKQMEDGINKFISSVALKFPKIIIDLLSPSNSKDEFMDILLNEIVLKDSNNKDILSDLIEMLKSFNTGFLNPFGPTTLKNFIKWVLENLPLSPEIQDKIKGLLSYISGLTIGAVPDLINAARGTIRDAVKGFISSIADFNRDINGILVTLWSFLYVGVDLDKNFNIGLKSLFNAKLLKLVDDKEFANSDIWKNFYMFKEESLNSIFTKFSLKFKSSVKLIKGETIKITPIIDLSSFISLINCLTKKTCWLKVFDTGKGNLTSDQVANNGKNGINVTFLKAIELINNNVLRNWDKYSSDDRLAKSYYCFKDDNTTPNESQFHPFGGEGSKITLKNLFDPILGKDIFESPERKDNDYLYKDSVIYSLSTIFGGRDSNNWDTITSLAQNQAFMCDGVLETLQTLINNDFKKSEEKLKNDFIDPYIDKKNWILESNAKFAEQFKNKTSDESHFYFHIFWNNSKIFPSQEYKVWLKRNDDGIYSIEKIT